MSYANASNSYRANEILAATPGRLVVITFDGLLAAMTRARVGFASARAELALEGIAKAREILAELYATLDFERGGDLAKRLAALYAFTLSELAALGLQPDLKRLDKNIAVMRELRDAFATIETAARAAVA